MLELINVTKEYSSGATAVKALKGVSVSFRRAEFVSVLGPSGCGKTTLLNIIGGLDRYTSGDLIIDGVSTKNYKDSDWDAYRNHSIGFVFQSYNLIPHQTVRKNVELALTISGIGKEERKRRAIAALERVGLADQLDKKPNQLSGGQMQRVAIARAIVNDPEIILADEPTGALDSETSVQVMEILKKLSSTRLVVMVTHNGELAEKYSSRIISLSDGLIVGDAVNTPDGKTYGNGGAASPKAFPDGFSRSISAFALVPPSVKDKFCRLPDESIITAAPSQATDAHGKPKAKKKKPSMSFLTALSLSLNNLVTKKARTILTSFAGSIGIIGIALILSLSSGFNRYITDVQRDTLSQYPITITQNTINLSSAFSSLLAAMKTQDGSLPAYPDEKEVTSNNLIENLLTNIINSLATNDLKNFKNYLDEHPLDSSANAVRYSYPLNMQVFVQSGTDGEQKLRRASPVKLPPFSEVTDFNELAGLGTYYKNFENLMRGQPFISEMIDNQKLVEDQYELLDGKWPEDYNDALIVVDEYNQISDIGLYMLGLMDDNDIFYIFTKLALRMQYPDKTEEELDAETRKLGYYRSTSSYTFDDLLSLRYKAVIGAEYYYPFTTVKKYDNSGNEVDFTLWKEYSEEEMKQLILDGNYTEIKVSGIVRKKERAATGALSSTLIYTKKLTDALIKKNASLPIVRQLLSQQELVSGGSFNDYFDIKYYGENHSDNGKRLTEREYFEQMKSFSAIDEDRPEAIYIYPKDFESKDVIAKYISDYNASVPKEQNIKYDDTVGLLMSSVTTIINAITYVLIAFVSISLVVSSIMIAVITNISVLERTKEIGVLRSIGASKRDVSNVFNAETFVIGLVSGIMGILITLILIIPINMIIYSLSGLSGVAALPVAGAFILIGISVLLTVLAGLIPARSASKKDPVVALRTE